MVTLLQAQKAITVRPVVDVTFGSASVGDFVARYMYSEEAAGDGRCSVWLDNG